MGIQFCCGSKLITTMKALFIVALATAALVQAEPEADGSWIRPGYYARPYGLTHVPVVKPSLVVHRAHPYRYYGYRVLGKREAEGEAQAEAPAEVTPEADAAPAVAYWTGAGPVHAAHGPLVATKRGFRNIALEGFSEDDNGDGFVDPIAQVGAPLSYYSYGYRPYYAGYYGYRPYGYRLWKREAEAEGEATAEATPEAKADPAVAYLAGAGPIHAANGPFVATRRGFRNIALEGFSEDDNGDGFVDPIAQVAPLAYYGYRPYGCRLWKREAEAEAEP